MAYTTIDDPSAYFTATLYTGNGSTQDITNNANAGNFKPDYIWTKARGGTGGHTNQNSNVGAGKQVYPNLTAAEETVSGVSAFLTNGFSLGSNGTSNADGITHIAWQWKANGGTTSSLSNTGPDSVVQVNSDAKFVIGTYTGNGSNSNVKHGLGETPDMLIVKRRTGGTGSWAVWHKDLTSAYWLRLDTTVAQASGVWDGTDPNSEKFFITGGSSNVNISGSDYVFYAWKGVQGYSKFSSYVGNGNANGPFVYTGFKPAFLLVKAATTAGQNWLIQDNKRPGYNPTSGRLFANTSGAENTDTELPDHLSNGFKVRSTSYGTNKSGETYIYMAFAESPFTSSTGIPTTAR